METKIIKEEALSEAAKLLVKGELVGFPTETVYGLGACLDQPEAIKGIFKVKGRPSDNPLIVHIASLVMAERLVQGVPDSFSILVEAFFPGPLTLVVKRSRAVSDLITGGLDTVALRMPSNRIALKLIEMVGGPLVAPSANLSGKPSSTTAEHVLDDFRGTIAGVIDGGECEGGIESTVVDLVSFPSPTILRPGGISQGDLAAALGSPVEIYSSGPKNSPGMKYRHYAPDLPVLLCTTELEWEEATARHKKSLRISPYSAKHSAHFLEPHTIYGLFRRAEKEGLDAIVVFVDESVPFALRNRLEKATGGFRSKGR